jgi:cold shock CspA family protein
LPRRFQCRTLPVLVLVGGFIATNPDEADVYFHGAGTVDRSWLPNRGQRVSFELVRGRDGRRSARKVAYLSDD